MGKLRAVKNLPLAQDSQPESLEKDFARLLREKDALERKISELDGRVFELNSLLRAGKGFSRILELDELLTTLSEMLTERFESRGITIYLCDEGRENSIHLRYSYPEIDSRHEALTDRGWFWQMAREGKPFSVKNLNGEPRFTLALEALAVPSHSLGVCVPLRKGSDLVGVLFLGDRRDGRAIDENEYPFIEEFAALAALNLDSVLKYEKNAEMLRNTRALFEIQEKLSVAHSEEAVHAAFSATVSKFLHLDATLDATDPECPLSPSARQLIGMLSERANEALKRVSLQTAALTDRLTGIANGRRFEEDWHRIFSEAKTQGKSVSIAIADIDHFKKFNDTYGHAAGDEVLRTVARVYRDTLARIAPSAQVYRYGGEEFAFLLPETTEPEAIKLLDRVRLALERAKVAYENQSLSVTASFGVAEFRPYTLSVGTTSATPNRLFKQADEAMYRSKECGRNRVTGASQI